MADLTITKNAAYDQKVAGVAILKAEMVARKPLITRLARQGDKARLKQWRDNDPLLAEIIKFIRQGGDFLDEIGDLLDD